MISWVHSFKYVIFFNLWDHKIQTWTSRDKRPGGSFAIVEKILEFFCQKRDQITYLFDNDIVPQSILSYFLHWRHMDERKVEDVMHMYTCSSWLHWIFNIVQNWYAKISDGWVWRFQYYVRLNLPLKDCTKDFKPQPWCNKTPLVLRVAKFYVQQARKMTSYDLRLFLGNTYQVVCCYYNDDKLFLGSFQQFQIN